MEKAFGSIPEKIRRSRQEIESEIENSKSALIESLKKGQDGLLLAIDERERHLLDRIELIHESRLTRGRWKLCVAVLIIGVVIGAAGVAAWGWKNAQIYNNQGRAEMWIRIK